MWNTKEEGEFIISLYNLKTDVSEQRNVADKHPEIVDNLKQMMVDFDAGL